VEEGEEKRGEFERVDVGQRRIAVENSGARNESSAVENSDRNQSDSICIMEKARDNVCTERVLRFSPVFLSFSLSLSLSLYPGPLNRTFLSFLLRFPISETSRLTADWFRVRVEPKSLLMGSFGFDHRLTFPIYRWYVSLVRPCFISSSLIYSSSYPSRSNLYRIVTERSSHPLT